MSEQTPRERVMALIQAVVPCSRSEAEDVYLLLSDEGLVPQTDPLGHVQVGDPDPCERKSDAPHCPVLWDRGLHEYIGSCIRDPGGHTKHFSVRFGHVTSTLDTSTGEVRP